MTSELNFRQWDPTKTISNIGGHTPRAFAEGSSIKVEFDTPKRSKHIGLDGQGRHIKSADRSGKVTVRMASYSPSNAAFIALDLVDIPFPIAIVDKASNGDSFFAKSCTLTQDPPLEFSDGETGVEYVFQFIRGRVYRAGAEADGLMAALSGLLSGI